MEKKDDYMLIFDNLIYDDGYLWFLGTSSGVVFKVDLVDGRIFPITFVERFHKQALAYRSMIKSGKFLYLFPFYARDICIYDIESREFRSVELPPDIFKEDEKEGFTHVVKYSHYLFAYGYPAVIVRYDINNDHIISYTGWEKQLPEGFEPVNNLLWKQSHFCNNKMYTPIHRTRMILELDIQTGRVRILSNRINSHRVELGGFKEYRNRIYSLSTSESGDGYLWLYDIDNGEIYEKKSIGLRNLPNHYYDFFEIIDNCIVFKPSLNEASYVVDLDSFEVDCVIDNFAKEYFSDPKKDDSYWFYGSVKISKSRIASIIPSISGLYIYDFFSRKGSIKKLIIPDDFMGEIYSPMRKSGMNCFEENRFISLAGFVNELIK